MQAADSLAAKEAANSPGGYNRPNIELSGKKLLRICWHCAQKQRAWLNAKAGKNEHTLSYHKEKLKIGCSVMDKVKLK